MVFGVMKNAAPGLIAYGEVAISLTQRGAVLVSSLFSELNKPELTVTIGENVIAAESTGSNPVGATSDLARVPMNPGCLRASSTTRIENVSRP